MKKKLLTILALVALAGAAAASAITVKQRQDTASLFAERYTIGELFALDTTPGLSPAAARLEAAGKSAEGAIELGPGNPVVRSEILRDHWGYTVVVQEKAQGAISSGIYVIDLVVDGVLVDSLYVKQATPDPHAVEGVRATFGLGASVSSSSLYYVTVRPYVPTAPIVSYRLQSNPNDNNTWVGVGAPVNGVVTPDLYVTLGHALALTAVNGDDVPHTIGLKSGTTTIDPPGFSGIINTNGQEVTIAWTPTATGSFTYNCGIHPDMFGKLFVVAPQA